MILCRDCSLFYEHCKQHGHVKDDLRCGSFIPADMVYRMSLFIKFYIAIMLIIIFVVAFILLR